ncbi:aspartic peptidase domain-containing protein [Mycena sp. CBHHK59/15]|nr:aspartic peptidase domain-containing protein [Mycena sp. CBHHK59/15]
MLRATLLSFLLLPVNLWAVSAKGLLRPRGQYIVDSNNAIINKLNDRYTLNLTVAGTTVTVILDTGSTDMWVQPPGGIGSFNDTGANATIHYGDGSNFVNGNVGLASVEIAGHQIPTQAFINVTSSVGQTFDFETGTFGLVGLGFDNPDGDIPAALTAVGVNGTVVGKSVLSSIFDQNPDKGRFFAFSLSRLEDVNDSADAELTISEYDEKYSDVQFAPLLPQFPSNSGRWGVLSDGVSVGGVDIPWTANFNKTPAGQQLVIFDTGTSNFLLPAVIRDAIYSAVPGAVLAVNSSIPNIHAGEDKNVWVVPCTTAINLTAKFGQEFPIHPLDLTDFMQLPGPDGKNHTFCIGSITSGGSITSPSTGFDALYGDSFLRNVYSVFGFGNDTTTPFVQLLSQTIASEAAADFASVRAQFLALTAPELSPADTIRLFDGPSAGTTMDSSAPACSPSTASGASDAVLGKAKTSADLADSNGSSTTDSQVVKYGPVIIGLLAANLVILLVLAFLGVMSFVRNGRTTGPTRALNPQYAPVKVKDDFSRVSFSQDKPYSD